MQVITHKHKINEVIQTKQSHIPNLFKIHKQTITIDVALISAILTIGYLLSSISSPNATMGSIFDSEPVYKNGLGAVNGYALTSTGLPALGTIVIAAEQGGLSKTISEDLTQEGKYVFQDLNPGNYVIIAYFPDGKYRVMNNIQVESDSVQTLIFKY